jgi:3-oxoadipate enol-lactonase
MPRASLDGVELEYTLRGEGDPVVLIHWGVCAAWAAPLLDAPALRNHRLLSYDRAGFGASGRIDGPLTMADHAEHLRLLLRELGLGPAHVVGHSSSALIALELAAAAPDAVRTLALLDPARPAPQTELQAAFLRDVAGPAIGRYREGDVAGAVDTWMIGVFGPGYREVLEAGLPGAGAQALAEADSFFGQELPAVQGWAFAEEDARHIDRPALIAKGEHSAPTFAERRELLLSWLPRAEAFDLPAANHLMHAQNPDGMAEALAGFFGRHASW